jgi:CubicO group peptidase (beta-lactamase class C family)
MDHLAEAVMRKWMIPGLSLAVVRDGRLLCAKGFGLADRERSRPATEHTIYPLASITKTFVATAVLLLAEEGALRLDDFLTGLLLDLPASWAPVTVRHLLSHTSGIKDCYVDAGFGYADAATPWDRIAGVARLRLSFPPGSKWEYSNTGYLLLGEVIARVTGQSYDSFLAERAFRPLGMTSTRVNDPRQADERWATGCRRSFRWRKLRTELVPVKVPHHLIAGSADGGLVSTATDLATWAVALAAGRVLRPETLREMWTPVRLLSGKEGLFGLGWAVNEHEGRQVVGHSGGDPGFAACLSHFPGVGVTVAVCANRGSLLFWGIHDAVFELTGEVARACWSQSAA